MSSRGLTAHLLFETLRRCIGQVIAMRDISNRARFVAGFGARGLIPAILGALVVSAKVHLPIHT